MNSGDIWFPNLGIHLSNVPKEFYIFGVRITFYAIFITLGMFMAFVVVSKVAKWVGHDPEIYLDLGTWLIPAGVIGTRIYYVIFNWDIYKDNLLSVFNIMEGGLGIYGGIILGFLTHLVFCKVKNQNVLKLSDVGFLGVLTGQIIGRWGNFTNRESFGTYTNNLLAMRLPISDVDASGIDANIYANIIDGTNYIQVHPTFLYESVLNLVLLVLMIIFQKKKKFTGEITLLYFGGYGIIRFFVEGLRTDSLLLWGTDIAISQVLGLSMFLMAVVMDVFIRLRIKKKAS